MTKKRILVVEDEADARWGVCQFLKKEGYDCVEAENGLKAYTLLKKEQIDVILSDLKMPELDGVELLKLCKRDRHPAVFIMMTAHGDCESYCDILDHGAYEYLNKPVSLNEVLALLKKIEKAGGS